MFDKWFGVGAVGAAVVIVSVDASVAVVWAGWPGFWKYLSTFK
jgi:hypothetical protein